MKKEVGLYIPAFISIALTILLVLVFTNELKLKKEQNKDPEKSYLLDIEKEENCSGINVYTNDISTYCIKEIYYNGEEKISLRSALNERITITEIIEKLSLVKEENNYKLYEDKDNIGNTYFRLLNCNNKYIIGNGDLYYKEEYCK